MLFFRKSLPFLSIILLGLFIFFAKDIQLDASSDSLIQKNDSTFEYYEYYNKIFPSKNFLILAIKSKQIIDVNYIDKINYIKSKIEEIENVDSTLSIVDLPILLLNNSKLSDLANKKIENINNSNKQLGLILEEFSKSPIFKNQIINKDKNVSSIIIYLNKNETYEKIKENYNNSDNRIIKNKYKIEKKINNKNKELLIKKIRNIIKKQNDDYSYFLGGIDMITSDTISFIKNDIVIFSFAVIFLIIIILYIIYKEIKWVLIPLITTIYSVLSMLGILGFSNWEITAISSNFILLMLILSISMNIHIINNYKRNYLKDNIKNKINFTLKQMYWPCIYTALTTIVAFGSLIFSNIKPVIDFGYIMMLSLLVILITSFTILPLIIYYLPNIKNNKLNFSVLNIFMKISIRKYKNIFIINILIFVLSIYGISKLNVENSFINYFKSNTQIFKGMKLIDTELGGTTPIDIILKFKEHNIENNNIKDIELNEELILDEDIELIDDLFIEDIDSNNITNGGKKTWFTNEKLKTIKNIHLYLEKRNEIGKVQSIDTLLQKANLINKKPLSIFELTILYSEIPDNYKITLIDPFLSIDKNMVKISSRVKGSNNIKRKKLIADIEHHIKSNYENIDVFHVNGLLVLYNNMLQSLFKSQIKSFGIILISIFIMFLILFKSVKLSIIAMIPNVIASSSILGLIGLLKIPLDIMTITIAAVTIGIAVDNTIHYIYRIKENKKNFQNYETLIEQTNNNVGNAIMTTSLTIACGFSILSLSNFVPTILFGIFTSMAMLIAMVGVLITLPAIIYKFKP